MKRTLVTLTSGDVERDFDIAHAGRLLKMHNSGWRLPSNSPFILTENGIEYKPTDARVGGAEQSSDIKKGADAPKAATVSHRNKSKQR